MGGVMSQPLLEPAPQPDGLPPVPPPPLPERALQPVGKGQRILLAGLPGDLASRVAARLGQGIDVAAVDDADEALRAVRSGETSVVVVFVLLTTWPPVRVPLLRR